uniref:Uncharacterized protein n=1 Tax=Caulobacter sp. (strain K31) TaxID=366602 RepID=B0SWM3_CAUSK
MADGSTTLTLDETLSETLERRAASMGISSQELAEYVLTQSLFRYDDYTWIGDDPRQARDEEEPIDLSQCTPWDEVERDLRARLEARLAEKA